MEASSRAARSPGPGSAVSFFLIAGIAAGGVVGVVLCIGIELGSIALSYGGIDFSEGDMATLVWLLFLVGFSLRGIVFGLMSAFSLPWPRFWPGRDFGAPGARLVH